MLAVMGGWVLFRCETLTHALTFYGALGGHAAGDPALHPVAEHLDPLIAATLAAAVIGATPVMRQLGRWRDAHAVGRVQGALLLTADGAWLAAVALMECAWLAAGTYNPFIYFRF